MSLRFKSFIAGLAIFFCAMISKGIAQTSMEKSDTDTQALLNYQDEISIDFLTKHLSAFAADSMGGRNTGTKELKKAAAYLAKQYEKFGLKPMGDDNSYLQKFDLNVSMRDSIVFETYAQEDGASKLIDRSVASKNSTANYVRVFGGSDTLSGEIVFAGFGVTDSSRDVAHLQGVDLKGKWVMVFQSIPHVVNGDTLINPALNPRARAQAIFARGAQGVLLIPDMNAKEFSASAMQAQQNFGKAGNMTLAYRDDEHSSGFAQGYNMISPQLAAKMLQVDSLNTYKEELIENITDFQPRALKYSLEHTSYSSKQTVETQNVLAYYEGADPKLKDEVVVLTSHYDHLGIGQPDSTGDRIYNGADDDGSGTIGVVNVAKALAAAGKEGHRPKRSVLFLNVSAEEKGLLGSRFYSDHPVIPMDKTVANINTDMIGRVDPAHEKEGIEEYAYIIGADIISSELDSLLKVANGESGNLQLDKKYNDLQDPNQFYRRSDHWNFGRFGVPFVFFFSGVHEDYHRPSDEVEKIHFEKMEKIVRTIYSTTVMVANAEKAPSVDNQAFIKITKSD